MSIRCWALKFGRAFAQNLRRSRPRPTGHWHLDEMVVKIRNQRMWLWRAVDDEGEVLDMLVQRRRNTCAALRLLRKLLKRNGVHPENFTTDRLASCRAAFRELHCGDRQRVLRNYPIKPTRASADIRDASHPAPIRRAQDCTARAYCLTLRIRHRQGRFVPDRMITEHTQSLRPPPPEFGPVYWRSGAP